MQNNKWDNNASLDKLAELSIKTGVALAAGRPFDYGPYEAALYAPFGYHAYKAGAGVVTPLFLIRQ